MCSMKQEISATRLMCFLHRPGPDQAERPESQLVRVRLCQGFPHSVASYQDLLARAHSYGDVINVTAQALADDVQVEARMRAVMPAKAIMVSIVFLCYAVALQRALSGRRVWMFGHFAGQRETSPLPRLALVVVAGEEVAARAAGCPARRSTASRAWAAPTPPAAGRAPSCTPGPYPWGWC
jgi:hypothetical protein